MHPDVEIRHVYHLGWFVARLLDCGAYAVKSPFATMTVDVAAYRPHQEDFAQEAEEQRHGYREKVSRRFLLFSHDFVVDLIRP